MPTSKYTLSKKDFESLNEILEDYRWVVLFTMGSADKQRDYIKATMKDENTDANYMKVLAEEMEHIQKDMGALLDVAKRRDELHNKIKTALWLPADEWIEWQLKQLKEREAAFNESQTPNATSSDWTVTEWEVIEPDTTGTV